MTGTGAGAVGGARAIGAGGTGGTGAIGAAGTGGTDRPLILATGNAGKVSEFQALLFPWRERLVSLRQVAPSARAPEETGSTYVENARIKALAAVQATGLPCLADDSGVEVAALGGAPGVYSARFAGHHGDDAANRALLVEKLQGVPTSQRQARFVAALVLAVPAEWSWASPDGGAEFMPAQPGRGLAAWPSDILRLEVEGTCRGRILEEERGEHGFGYDPLFFLPALGQSAAEVAAPVKNRVSHRARAARLLFPVLTALLGAGER